MTLLYAALAILVGAWRHLDTGDSIQALWFGLFVAGLAVGGSFLLRPVPGWSKGLAYLLIAISLVFESGWFLRRMLTHEEGASLRVLLILSACAVELVVLLWPGRRHA